MSLQLSLVLACGGLALVYGGVLVRSVLAGSAGTKEMQDIAAAIQEGAQAYLNRQYTAIAMAGVVIFIGAFFALGWQVAEIETRRLAAELHGERLEFRPSPNGRPTRVVTRVDTVAFDERWLNAVRATCR